MPHLTSEHSEVAAFSCIFSLRWDMVGPSSTWATRYGYALDGSRYGNLTYSYGILAKSPCFIYRFVAIFHSHVKLPEGRWHSQWLLRFTLSTSTPGRNQEALGPVSLASVTDELGQHHVSTQLLKCHCSCLSSSMRFHVSHRVWSDKWKCIQLYHYHSAAKWGGKPYHYPSMFYLLLGSNY